MRSEGYSSCLVCVCVCVCLSVCPHTLLPSARIRSEGYSSCLVCVCLSVRTRFYPRRACASRVTVVVSCVCVCVSVCLSAHAILVVRAIKSITKDTIVFKHPICGNIKMAFFLKLSYSKVRTFFTPLGRGGHL